MGTKENDIIFGKFADSFLATFSNQDLQDYEKLLQQPDTDLQRWLQGQTLIPNTLNTAVWKKLQAFYITLSTGL